MKRENTNTWQKLGQTFESDVMPLFYKYIDGLNISVDQYIEVKNYTLFSKNEMTLTTDMLDTFKQRIEWLLGQTSTLKM